MNTLRAVALVTSLLVPALSQASLLTNGSFENPGIASGTWTIANTLPGWQVSASGVELRNNAVGVAQDGKNFIELDTRANSAISQTVATQAAHDYVLSGYFSPRIGVTAASNDVDVFWNGTRLTTLGGTGVGYSSHQWRQFSFTVAGTGNDTLRFAAAGTSDSYGGSLDNVALTAVPEPASVALVLAALGAAGAASRRRTR